MFGIFRKCSDKKSQKIKWADTMKWKVLDGYWFVELYLYEDGSRDISISDKESRSLIDYRDFNEVRIISDELNNLVDWLEMMIESEGLDKL